MNVYPRVTIVRDKVTRKSLGTAFLLYLTRTEALACVSAVNKTELMGRTLTAAMAKDNGRAAEFIKRKEYPDKSRQIIIVFQCLQKSLRNCFRRKTICFLLFVERVGNICSCFYCALMPFYCVS
jgi:RNA recognition motif-containing protein